MKRSKFFSHGFEFSFLLVLTIYSAIVPSVEGGVVVTPTMNPADLMNSLTTTGLTINSVVVLNGVAGQYGTYTNFTTQPITIGDGIVLSTGNVAALGPPADPSLTDPQPSFDMATLGTPEFDTYGSSGRIENFSSSNDVAVLQVDFHLDAASQIKFDFVFGTVEYPFYTSSFTDSFLVFLDGTSAGNQVTFDVNGDPVQVGRSFASRVSIADQNTAFADPHGLLALTTTTAPLSAGDHTLLFEIGDVNDHVLDSAVFITNLRAEAGEEGTDLTDPEDPVIPEPGTMTILVMGFASADLIRRRKQTA